MKPYWFEESWYFPRGNSQSDQMLVDYSAIDISTDQALAELESLLPEDYIACYRDGINLAQIASNFFTSSHEVAFLPVCPNEIDNKKVPRPIWRQIIINFAVYGKRNSFVSPYPNDSPWY